MARQTKLQVMIGPQEFDLSQMAPARLQDILQTVRRRQAALNAKSAGRIDRTPIDFKPAPVPSLFEIRWHGEQIQKSWSTAERQKRAGGSETRVETPVCTIVFDDDE